LEVKRVVSFTSNSELFPRLERLVHIWFGALVIVLCFVILVSISTFSWFYDPTSFDEKF
jgi:hypothetical protein